MKATLLWAISDFPTYGMLSAWSTHGKFACPYCMRNIKSFGLVRNLVGLIVINICLLIFHFVMIDTHLSFWVDFDVLQLSI